MSSSIVAASAPGSALASDTPDVRQLAAQLMTHVVKDGSSLGELLPAAQEPLSARDAALLQELVFGTSRWSGRLQAQLALLMPKPLRRKDTDVNALLWLALYELQYMRSPDYAVVNAYAGLTGRLRKKWAKSLVNGVLRQFLRNQADIVARADKQPEGRSSLPGWILKQLRQDWPDSMESIVAAGNTRAPLTLRVNGLQCTRSQYLQALDASGLSGRDGPLGAHAVIVESSARVSALPGFDDGWFSVQDGAAQLAAELVDPQPGQRILDACAAPGGKTCHLAEMQPEIMVTAVDNSETRMQRVHENLQRLQLKADCRCADAADTGSWWDGRSFDSVLLDAPCSALGVLRRHPDIRLLRREQDIDALCAQQQRLLEALWPTVKPGGKLVYATCSVLKRENQQQVISFLTQHDDAAEEPINAPWGIACEAGRQILPGQHEADGFYYAIIRKKSVEDAC